MLYSSNIYKFHQVNINDDTLLIDNNERIAKKIESLEPQILKEVGGDWNEEPTDDFFSGLDAEQVDALLGAIPGYVTKRRGGAGVSVSTESGNYSRS